MNIGVIIQSALEAATQLIKLLDLAKDPRVQGMNQAEVEAEIAKIKLWAKTSSDADWAIVKGGKDG